MPKEKNRISESVNAVIYTHIVDENDKPIVIRKPVAGIPDE